MVINDAISSGVGFVLQDIFNGRWGRAGAGVLRIPTMPAESWLKGRQVGKAYLNDKYGSEQLKLIAKALEQSNMRTFGMDHND